jgi:hypothetical protein
MMNAQLSKTRSERNGTTDEGNFASSSNIETLAADIWELSRHYQMQHCIKGEDEGAVGKSLTRLGAQ